MGVFFFVSDRHLAFWHQPEGEEEEKKSMRETGGAAM